MSATTLRRALQAHDSIVVDSSVIVAYLDGRDVFSAAATIVVDELAARGATANLSAITVTESLVRPMKLGNADAVTEVATFFGHFPGIHVLSIDVQIAQEAARVRAVTGLKTPDAMIIATALIHGIPTIVTADGRWRSAIEALTGLELIEVGEHLPL
jgi:predicted nucleic acid-binding protein